MNFILSLAKRTWLVVVAGLVVVGVAAAATQGGAAALTNPQRTSPTSS